MNILYISPFSHAYNISPELRIANFIAEKGNSVHFYTVKTSYLEHSSTDSANIVKTPSNVEMHYVDNYFLYPKIAYPFVNPLRVYNELLELIEHKDVELLHFNYPEYLINLPMFRKKSLKVPIIISVNAIPGYDWFYGDKLVDLVGKIYSKLFVYRLLEKSDVIIPSSSQCMDTLISMGFGDKLEVMSSYGGSYGINTSFFKQVNKKTKYELREKYGLPQDSLVIIYAGRIVKVKRLDVLIKSMVKLKEKLDNVVLILVGEGPEKENLLELSNTLLLNNIFFIDFVDQETVGELFSASDIFTLLSSGEGNAVVLLEATSSGLPCLVSNVGGSSDIIEHEISGLVLNDVNEENVARGIEHIAEDQCFFSDNARKLAVKNFSWDVIVDNYLRLYKSLL